MGTHWLTMKSTNLFLFPFYDNSRLHFLISKSCKSICMLNSSTYFSLHPLLNCFHQLQKQHQFFLIDFHLIKHIWQTHNKFRYNWTLKVCLRAQLSCHQPHKHCLWGILSQVQHLSLIYVKELTLVRLFFRVLSASAKYIDIGVRRYRNKISDQLNISAE